VKPLARFVGFAVAGVPPEIMGIGPIKAIPKVLKAAGMKHEDIDWIELNEAFASQALAVLRDLGVADDAAHVNPSGGAIALGHPLGATGGMLVGTLLDELERQDKTIGLCTMCIGYGMGIATIIERV